VIPSIDDARCPIREVTLSFMSTHPASYLSLKDNPDAVSLIRQVEAKYTAYPIRYIPKDTPFLFSLLREGDVVALLTTIEGLDVSHLGLVVEEDDGPHLLHASSATGKVVIDPRPLPQMLRNRKSCPGIRAVRLK